MSTWKWIEIKEMIFTKTKKGSGYVNLSGSAMGD